MNAESSLVVAPPPAPVAGGVWVWNPYEGWVWMPDEGGVGIPLTAPTYLGPATVPRDGPPDPVPGGDWEWQGAEGWVWVPHEGGIGIPY